MWPNFLQFYLGFFLGRNVFRAAALLGIFLSPQSVVIVSSLHYNLIITKAHQMANLLTYLHVEQALGLGTKNMLNFLINLFTSRNGFLSMSFKSTSSSIFLHPKYYLKVVLRTFFLLDYQNVQYIQNRYCFLLYLFGIMSSCFGRFIKLVGTKNNPLNFYYVE